MGQLLQIFTNRRIAVTLLLSFASGLPLPLVTGTLDAWMAKEGVKLTTIGFFSLVGLPYTVKYLWAPFLDRFLPPFLNRRTGWMVITQLLLVGSLTGMAFSNPTGAPAVLAFFAVLTAFFSASQDIVIDGYRTELLHKDELGAGAAVTVLGGRLALLTGGAVALALADRTSWRNVYLVMAALMSIGLVTAVLSPAPEGDVAPPKRLIDAVVNPFVDYFRRPGAIGMLLFIVFYKLGDAFAGKMTTPFLIKTGYSLTSIAALNKGFGMLATIAGALFGGSLIARLGMWRSLLLFGVLQALSNLVFLALASGGPDYRLLVACIGVENLTGGMGTAAFVAFLMSLCERRFSATQYALLSSLSAVGRTFVGPAAGYTAERLGWAPFFVVSTFVAVPGLALLLTFRNELIKAPPANQPG